jgi:ATP-binding cassette subfamily F protein uup
VTEIELQDIVAVLECTSRNILAKKYRNLARSELAWLRRGAPARTSKPRARIEAATAIVEGRAEAPARLGDLDLAFGAPRLGDTVVELRGVGHRFDGGPWLFRGVDLALDPRERLGIVGPNGAGKSTLLDILAGRLVPAEGEVVTGQTVAVGVYDQVGRELDPALRVDEAVAGPYRRPDWEDARFLGRFWFDADAQRAPIGLLSGGERRRLQLVLTLRAKPNVLLLDEPTNDLDVDTLRVLEDVLETWPGAVVVVSHDRALLERTVTDVLVIDEDHPGRRLPGGYARWESGRRARRVAGRASPPRPRGDAASRDREERTATRPAATGSAAPPSRSPSTVRRLLRETEKRLESLDRRRVDLVEELTSAGADREALARTGTALAEVDAEHAAAEHTWLTLAEELDEA